MFKQLRVLEISGFFSLLDLRINAEEAGGGWKLALSSRVHRFPA